jgi:hypothetical protein
MRENTPMILSLLKKSDGLLFIGANAADLAGLVRRIRDDLGIEPPDDLMDLLRQSDGAIADGLMIYGSKARAFDAMEMPELVVANLDRHEYRDDLAGTLLIGERDDDLIAYDVAAGDYCLIDRASGEKMSRAPDLLAIISALIEER